ncbi:UDP-3-O-(3-hydroxymyristoyl)glucosamine N-acyltransferase [Methylogaea oryzae]|uniref:UDP-3-O-acylglucosamine N-acyltransferase n=1 Tax=Methylogaea oryzae TaxID=1295382 RepID=A0A8D4VNK3_9GAMM|nr:UDP-3-O-(3-hydroxymyristoyl)glucosamine N-acyltransferase [Methylogaea oryzae]BBL69829.1 UDP-3-O-acylglucosamine N-acyltransferase [Methylogaea oryzae]
MNLRTSEIFQRFKDQGLLTEHRGPDSTVQRIAPIEDCGPGDLVFADRAKFLDTLRAQRPAAVVADRALAEQLAEQTELAVLVSPNVKLAMALLRQAYDDRDLRISEWPRVHATAVIHDSVALPDDAIVGPGAVIGANVRLGANTVIMANAVVEHDAVIGANTVLHPGVVVCYNCEIGSDCILKPGCVIGAEGFGFAQDERRRNYRIPHMGRVVIGDRVVIGANTTVDRGTYGETRIKSGTIVDALCHFGHNVELGEDCIICAQTGLSGSTRFGNRVIATGQTGTIDHVQVPDNTVLLHRAGLPNSIKEPGMYAGGPAQPLKEYKRNIAMLPRLHEMWTRLKALEKKLDDSSE